MVPSPITPLSVCSVPDDGSCWVTVNNITKSLDCLLLMKSAINDTVQIRFGQLKITHILW